MDYEQAFSTSNIQLEPRLQEFINRKTFNRENDIRPDIPEEQEFSITLEDRDIIKRYMKGRRHIYSKKRTGHSSHFVAPLSTDENFFTGKDAFKSDPRYQRLKKKMESHKKARAQISNLDGIDEDYVIFHRSNPYDDPSNPNVKRPMKISKPYDDPSNYEEDDLLSSYPDDNHNRGIYRRSGLNRNSAELIMMDSRDLVLGSSKGDVNNAKYMYNPNNRAGRKSENSYNHRSKISYRNTLIPEKVNGGLDHNHSVNDIIGHLDEYNRHLDDTYDYIDAEIDQDSHNMRPRIRNNSSRDNYSGYKSIPYGYGGGLADISVENSLRGGIRDSKSKTTGFKNSFEHQFDYIDSDISDPNHTVEMRPESTRGANKTMARPNSRSAQSEARFKANIYREYEAQDEDTSNYIAHNRGYANPRRTNDDMRNR